MNEDGIFVLPTKMEKAIGCLAGQLIGSGLGMPWKTLSKLEIMLITRRNGVEGFSEPHQTKDKAAMNLEPGQPTEDYKLMRTVAQSLIYCHGFNLMDCLQEYLGQYEDNWNRHEQFVSTDNRVARKIAPLALYFNEHPEDLYEAVKKLGAATHDNPQAHLAAYLIAWVIREVYNNPIGLYTKEQLSLQIVEMSQRLVLETAIREKAFFNQKESPLLIKMKALAEMIDSGEIADPEEVAEVIGTGSVCFESVPYAIAMFMRHPTNYSAAVIETINQGGDTDSNAAMVGAMVGANLGARAIPQKWLSYRTEYEEAGELAVELYKLTANS